MESKQGSRSRNLVHLCPAAWRAKTAHSPIGSAVKPRRVEGLFGHDRRRQLFSDRDVARRAHDRRSAPSVRRTAKAWHAAIARTSAGTLYFRFFAVKSEVSEKEADYFLDIDFVKHVALVAVVGRRRPADDCRRRALCTSSSQASRRSPSRSSTNIRAKGIGSALLRHLAAIGREAGLARTHGGGPLGKSSDAKGL